MILDTSQKPGTSQKPLRLLIRTDSGQRHKLNVLFSDSTMYDLKLEIEKLTKIVPDRQKILSGRPPKEVDGNEGISTATLKHMGIESGSMLIVRDDTPKPESEDQGLSPSAVKRTSPLKPRTTGKTGPT